MDRVGYQLHLLLDKACQDEALRKRLLSTRQAADPMAEFCRIAC